MSDTGWLFSSYLRMRAVADAVLDERGQDLVEYAVVASLISLAAIAGVSSVATAVSAAYAKIGIKFAAYTS
jgi:Flp pilus assembly pilin Flp